MGSSAAYLGLEINDTYYALTADTTGYILSLDFTMPSKDILVAFVNIDEEESDGFKVNDSNTDSYSVLGLDKTKKMSG